MSFIDFIIRDLDKTVKGIEAEGARVTKAMETAVKVEGYRLMKILKEQLRAGKPGGSELDPLTEIGKRYGKPINRKPLSRLAPVIRYGVERRGDGMVVGIGFIDYGSKKLSKSWLRIAEEQQEGAIRAISEERRKGIISIGVSLAKRKDATARFFFLRETTQTAKIPPRPVIGPFISAHLKGSGRIIVSNFERKMRGERI
jgi:hypothetical protein